MQSIKKLSSSTYSICLIIGAFTLITLGGELITNQTSVRASEKQPNEIYERGSQVMPFDQNITKHTFMPNSNGGVQTVAANDSSPT